MDYVEIVTGQNEEPQYYLVKGDTIYEAKPNVFEYKYVQVINGKVCAAFKKGELYPLKT